MKKKQMCVDFQSKLSGVTNMRQEFTVCQIKNHFSIVCRFSLFSLDLLLCIAAVVRLLMVGMPQLQGHILKVCPSSTSNPQVKHTFILLYCFTMFE